MLETLNRIDTELLLFFNGLSHPFLDDFFWVVTQSLTWIPFYAAIVYVIMKKETDAFKHKNLHVFGAIAVCVGLVVLFADQSASGFAKPFFERFRPSHQPALEGVIQLYMKSDGSEYRGGTYGFFSSHAANSFGIAAFVIAVLRSKSAWWVMSVWAVFFSYSRIHLGVHYPGDILAGAIVGSIYGATSGYLFGILRNTYWSEPTPRS